MIPVGRGRDFDAGRQNTGSIRGWAALVAQREQQSMPHISQTHNFVVNPRVAAGSMGGGISGAAGPSDGDITALVNNFLKENSNENNTKTIFAVMAAAHAAGVDMNVIQRHITKLLEVSENQRRPDHWAFEWSPNADAAVQQRDFQAVDGFSHTELCIYDITNDTESPFIDPRFDDDLKALFSAFYRDQSKEVHPLEIIKITAIENSNLRESMISSSLKIREQISLGGAYGTHWKNNANADTAVISAKEQVLGVMGLSDQSACILGFAGQANPQICKNICSNGFADLAKTDPGYFGRGVYLSTHSEYAALYACSSWGWKDKDGEWRDVDIKGSVNDIAPGQECTILAAHATPGICYPITRETDYADTFCWCDLKGKGMRFGYHSHAVLVNRLQVLREMNYQCMHSDADPYRAYGELVVQQTGQALPRYVLQCRRKNDADIQCAPTAGTAGDGSPFTRIPEPDIFPNLQKDLQSLVQFFEDTNGLNWKVHTNWVKNVDLATWKGPAYPIGLTADNAVDRLRLPSNNVCGIFSSCISSLTMLRILDLSDNKLCGDIPTGIGKLTHLEEFYIDKNNLSGALTMLLILRKSSLGRRCRIGHQQQPMNGSGGGASVGFALPKAWGALAPDAHAFACKYDTSLGDVSKVLLSDSSLIGELEPAMLSYFTASGAGSTTTGTLVHGTPLLELDLSKNTLSGLIPNELGLLTALQRVDLSTNNLSGYVPSALAELSNLRDLILSHNSISGEFPSFIGSLTALKNLDLSHNKFTGNIKEVFENLTDLVRLELGNNQFTGALPQSIAHMNSLILLSCECNAFSGDIPVSYGDLASLRGLNLSSNKLHGQFPGSIAALTTLQRIYISKNEISGNLPVLSAHYKLRVLNFSDNLFTGNIPEEWKLLTSLETVFLTDLPQLNVDAASNIFGARVELML